MTKKTQKAADAASATELQIVASVDNQSVEPAQNDGSAPEAIENTGEDANEIEAEEGEATAADGEIDQSHENQPDAQQALADMQTEAPDANQSSEMENPISEDPAATPTIELLKHLIERIDDMLVWRRPDLIRELAENHGMIIDRSLEGARVTMADISAASPIIGPTGEFRALENWANGARRKILELEADA